MSTSELAMLLVLARYAGLTLLTVAVFVTLYVALSVEPSAPPAYGVRGKKRAQALTSGAYRMLDPLVRQVSAWLSRLPSDELRAHLAGDLRAAGEPLGLSADELCALSMLAAVFWLSTARLLGLDALTVVALALLVLALPAFHVRHVAKQRAEQLERSLPNVMDLTVLCMSAGADFPAALAFVAADLGAGHEVCKDELSQVLDELALGRTRIEALEAFGERTRSRAVREMVASLCQSEKKGTPLIDSLSIQTSTLRRRRSVRAEELAAKAGVKMMLPMMLMVGSLLLIIFGPFIVNGMGL